MYFGKEPLDGFAHPFGKFRSVCRKERLKVLDLNHENDLKTQITKYISLISKTLGFEYEKADCIEIIDSISKVDLI